MAYEKDIGNLDHEIEPDPRYARVLVKIADSSGSDKEAEKLIETLNIHIVSKTRLSIDWVLFTLNVRDMRDAVLKLSEHGFIVKGINAIP